MTTPLWFLRVNPLPRTRLADGGLRAALAELVAAEQETAGAAAACSAELYAAVGDAADEADRKRLVAARRAVHRDRPLPEGAPALPALRHWSDARDRRERARAAAAELAGPAAARERSVLAGLLADDDLRRSLVLLAPDVAQEAERYRAAVAEHDGAVPARVRKAERGLLQYVTRAMLRTSPLSRLTAVGLAVPGPDGTDPSDVRFAGATAFPGVDLPMLGYVVAGLDAAGGPVPDPDGRWVCVPPTAAVDHAEGRVYLLRPDGAGLRRLSTPLTPALLALVDAVVMGPRPAGDVAADVAAATGCTPAAAAALVASALQGGLLCAAAGAEPCTTDVAALLDRPGTPLDEVRERLPRVADLPAETRGAELDAIRAGLAATSRQAGRPALVVVTEDYVLPPATVDPAHWAARLDDLGAATELMSLHDWMHDVRALMSAAVVDRFGAGADVPLAATSRWLVEEVARRAVLLDAAHTAGHPVPAGVGPADGSLDGLLAVRRDLTAEVHSRLDKAATGGDHEVVLPAVLARGYAAALPARFRRDPLVYGVLVQSWADRLVVNDGLPGHGMLFGRFLGHDARLGGDALPRLRARLHELFGADGSRVVEDLGLHGLNVNAHPQVLAHGLTARDWPGLRLVHDPDTDALRVHDADGRHLTVLPVGAGHPGMFPPPLSVASGLVLAGRLQCGLVDTWHAAAGWDGRDTRACPRLSVGSVVVSRGRWFGGTEFPRVLADAADDAARPAAVAAWRARHGVPEEVVVKTATADDGPPTAGSAVPRADRRRHKPQYVDLASALALRVLPRMLDRREGTGEHYLEEALPGVGDGPHAAEWVVEIGRRPGGGFRYGEEPT